MYPYNIFGEFDLYMILITLGAAGCLILVRLLADRIGLADRITNLTLASGIFGMAVGYVGAVLFQSFYDFLETGKFVFGSGATFYGGLIGGALGFLTLYFVGGHFFCQNGEHRAAFFRVSALAACGITFAHGLGRLGCLAEGCCHGLPTDAWSGIYMVNLDCRVVPTQLFEALFLLALCALLVFLLLRGKRGLLALYMGSYGVFRFLLEFLRADDRGGSPVPLFSPSQFTAILMLLGAGVLYAVEIWLAESEKADPCVAKPDSVPPTENEK